MTGKTDTAAARRQRLAKALKANIGRRKAGGEPDPLPADDAQNPGESAKPTSDD